MSLSLVHIAATFVSIKVKWQQMDLVYPLKCHQLSHFLHVNG